MKERDLVAEERALEAEILERQQELQAVRILLNRIRKKDGQPPLDTTLIHPNNGNAPHKRVRGTLKAARNALPFVGEEFGRAELFQMVENLNSSLVGRIKPEAMRMVIRTLIDTGKIKEILPGTKDVPARYKNLTL